MRRLGKVFHSDGKSVIVAMDHGMGMPVNPALDHIGDVLRAVVKGGADAILTTFGIAEKYADELRNVGLILRMDGGGSSLYSGDECPSMLYSIEDALRLGADAVACMGFPGAPYEHACMQQLAKLTSDGRAWGMPVMAEMLPGGFNPAVPNSIENLVISAHAGCEYGASIIKTAYTGPVEEFKKVIAASYQPVVVLGGAQTKDLSSLFECIEQAMAAGAAGVAIGRNVWNNPDPERVTRALVDLVHNGKSAAEVGRF